MAWNFFAKRGIVEKPLITQLKDDLPKGKQNTRPKMISQEELMQVFAAFDKDLERKLAKKYYKQGQKWFKPMMATYFYGGFRRAELAYDEDLPYSGMKGKYLEYVAGELEMIYIPPGKGRTERLVPIAGKLKKYLLPYLEQRGPVAADDYIFVYNRQKKGWPVTARSAYDNFKKYIVLSDVPNTRTIHGMRHNKVTSCIEDGYSLKEAQLMAGHSTSITTEKYTHLVGRDLLKNSVKLKKMKNS